MSKGGSLERLGDEDVVEQKERNELRSGVVSGEAKEVMEERESHEFAVARG